MSTNNCNSHDLTVISEIVDSTFSFKSLDCDGKIRMDPSFPYAMQQLLDMNGRVADDLRRHRESQ